MEEENSSQTTEKKPWYQGGLLNYKDKDSKTVFSLFGIEMTAPAGLKNPGIVYISFIVINMFVFFVIKSFVAN